LKIVTTRIYESQENLENLVHIEAVPAWDFMHLPDILRILDELRPDIIHLQHGAKEYGKNPMINLLPALLTIWRRWRIVQTLHEFSLNSFLGKLRYFPCIALSIPTIVVAKHYPISVRSFFSALTRARFIHIPVGSSIERSKACPEKLQKLKITFTGDPEAKLLAFFGIVHPEKGIAEFLGTLAKLNENLVSAVHLVIIADLVSGNPCHDEIFEKIGELALGSRVKVTGFLHNRDEVADILAASDIAVFPFRSGIREGNTSLLAASCQDIAIVATHPTLRGFDHEMKMTFVAPADEEKIFLALKDELRSPHRVSRRATPSWDDIAQAHIKVYEASVGRR
jgi:glycosyltransferase involved in cell wall biosynthesis